MSIFDLSSDEQDALINATATNSSSVDESLEYLSRMEKEAQENEFKEANRLEIERLQLKKEAIELKKQQALEVQARADRRALLREKELELKIRKLEAKEKNSRILIKKVLTPQK